MEEKHFIIGFCEVVAGLPSPGRLHSVVLSPRRATAAPQREDPGAGAGVEQPGEPRLGFSGAEEVPAGREKRYTTINSTLFVPLRPLFGFFLLLNLLYCNSCHIRKLAS